MTSPKKSVSTKRNKPDTSSPDQTQLLKRALHYLKYRLRTRSEIEIYLSRKFPQSSSEHIQAVIQRLADQNLIDDSRFCREYIRSLLNKGKGPIVIKYKLRKLGIPDSQIQTQLSQIPHESIVQSAQELLHKKKYRFNKLKSNLKPVKIKQYLYRRGYPSNIINTVIDDYPSAE